MFQRNIKQFQGELPAFSFYDHNTGRFKDLSAIVNEIIPLLFAFAGLILLLYLLWGGFSLMLSSGDPKAVEGGKAKITTALTGFVIIFVAYWLVQLLSLIFGINQVQGTFK